MKKTWTTVALMLASMVGACGNDGVVCTTNIVSFEIRVSSPEGLPVEHVTAEQNRESECMSTSEGGDASLGGAYPCWEQGSGEYVLRVRSGDRTWTRRVTVKEDPASDGCHIEMGQGFDIELTAASADPAE
ncbi:MAG: hypothetical protein QM778_18580 [Myxococcales bacterium]